MGNWKLTRAQEPTALSAQARREMRNGQPAGLSRRQLIRRSVGAGVGLWLLEVGAGTIGFLWPNLSRGFGGEIQVPHNVFRVFQAHDLDGTVLGDWNVQSDGTRHRAVYRLCSVEPGVIGFVISQDSQVRMIANVEDSVMFWMHSTV